MEQEPLAQLEIELAEAAPEAAGQAQARHGMVLLLKQRLAGVRRELEALIAPFIEQYTARLVRAAARMVGSQDAPDVAQAAFETFTRWIHGKPIAEARKLLASHEDLLRLMLKFISCRAVDHLRSKKKRDDPLVRDGQTLDSAIDDAATARPEFADEIKCMTRAYEAMPPEQRIVHILCRCYRFTDAEVEATLKIKRSTVRGLVYRANLELRRAMERKP